MESLTIKRDVNREFDVYTIVWDLNEFLKSKDFLYDSNPQLSDYLGGRTRKTKISSGKIHCKSFLNEISGACFEFFIKSSWIAPVSSSAIEVNVFAKISGGLFEVIAGNLSYTNRTPNLPSFKVKEALQLIPPAEWPKFSIASVNDKNLEKELQWMKATLSPASLGFSRLTFDMIIEQNGKANGLNPRLSTTNFLFSEQYSDVTIKCAEKEYKAHKIIICNRSPVLERMFSQPMTESKTGILTIEDAEIEIVEEFLRFLYTDLVKDLEKNAVGLLLFAEKYEVEDLKLLCEESVWATISAENVLDRYALGNLVNSKPILSKCVEKIKTDKNLIWKTKEEFQESCNQFPELVFQLFVKVEKTSAATANLAG